MILVKLVIWWWGIQRIIRHGRHLENFRWVDAFCETCRISHSLGFSSPKKSGFQHFWRNFFNELWLSQHGFLNHPKKSSLRSSEIHPRLWKIWWTMTLYSHIHRFAMPRARALGFWSTVWVGFSLVKHYDRYVTQMEHTILLRPTCKEVCLFFFLIQFLDTGHSESFLFPKPF